MGVTPPPTCPSSQFHIFFYAQYLYYFSCRCEYCDHFIHLRKQAYLCQCHSPLSPGTRCVLVGFCSCMLPLAALSAYAENPQTYSQITAHLQYYSFWKGIELMHVTFIVRPFYVLEACQYICVALIPCLSGSIWFSWSCVCPSKCFF